MRAIVATFILLTGIGWYSTTVEISGSSAVETASCDYGHDPWRRTANGWEDARTWRQTENPIVDIRGVHPTAVAIFTFFACVGGLVAFCPSLSRNGRKGAADEQAESSSGCEEAIST